MILVCHNAFGNFVPGDEVEVPDGAVFDGAYFHEPESISVDVVVVPKLPLPEKPKASEPAKQESN